MGGELARQLFSLRALRVLAWVGLICGAPAAAAAATDIARQPGYLESGFVYEEAPFPECHASTLAESGPYLIAAWFGGTHEKHEDVGIWVSRRAPGEPWSKPVEVADGVQHAGLRYPCWNPVLQALPDGTLHLFYKVGPSPQAWWGMQMTSSDQGATWSLPRRLPEEILGPIKNKPCLLNDGTLICGSSTEHDGWRVHLEWTRDGGRTWERTAAIDDATGAGAIQPTLLTLGENHLRMLCRCRRGNKILAADSQDGGRSWSTLRPTELPNPNSGIDGVTLRDGRHVLIYNHTPRGRTPLNVAVSDDATHWHMALVLEDTPGEYSYPAVIQTADGKVHVSYTWKRKRIKHVVIDPDQLNAKE